jgi:4-amino-4-deoxy-L-arabinose transferase-like glycosyltransferase
VRRRLQDVPGPLWLLIVLASVLALAWVIVTPPLTNADETGHFAYVQHLAETGSAPTDRGTRTLSSEEQTLLDSLALQPTIGNVSARPSFSPIDRRAFDDFEGRVTHDQRADGDGPNQFAQNGPLYYAAGAVAYRVTPGGGIIDRVFVVRLLGAAAYVAIVVLVWLLAAELFTAVWPRAVAAGAVALQPKLGNTAGMVNPDILLALLWTAFALVGVRAVRHGLTVRRAVALGLLTGGSALTHGRGLALIVPLIVVLALSVPRLRVDWRRLRRPAGYALGIVAACVLFGFFYTRAKTGGAYGGELTQAAGGAGSGGSVKGLLAYIFNFYFGGYQALGPLLGADFGYRQGYIVTFFGSFGSLDVDFQPHIYDWLQFLAGAGLVVLWTQVVWFRARLLARWREVAVLLALVIAQIGLLHLASYRDLVQSNGVGVLWSGRYLLPLIAVFGITVAYVCSHLPRRVAALAGGGVVAVGVVLQLAALRLTLDRFYG